MAKNNIRSVRFSDEMIEIINQQVGENFTQKFERMVYNCYMLLPEKERQAERLDILAASGYTPKLGDEVIIEWNRWGKCSGIRLAKF